jgi:hypothetical protein
MYVNVLVSELRPVEKWLTREFPTLKVTGSNPVRIDTQLYATITFLFVMSCKRLGQATFSKFVLLKIR